MSRKQDLYRDILSWALPYMRNGLSVYQRPALGPRWLSLSAQRALRHQYELVHNIHFLILDEEWTLHDIGFLNFQARSFFERGNERDCFNLLLAPYIQELFAIVPGHLRPQLQWPGPQGDYLREGWRDL